MGTCLFVLELLTEKMMCVREGWDGVGSMDFSLLLTSSLHYATYSRSLHASKEHKRGWHQSSGMHSFNGYDSLPDAQAEYHRLITGFPHMDHVIIVTSSTSMVQGSYDSQAD